MQPPAGFSHMYMFLFHVLLLMTLYEDIDFMSVLTCARFKELCGDLFCNTLKRPRPKSTPANHGHQT
ncbi:hypothetical protein M405DRAFT_831612 [Rhizopogon salebrosus TDB-379]|nr:hypothetical protein M405DRAFT_831612 [Rhizopogon salebrosus TDB-379]